MDKSKIKFNGPGLVVNHNETEKRELPVDNIVITPQDAANALDVVVTYLKQTADWKEREGFTKAPRAEREKAEELKLLKFKILGLAL